jgi:MFS family permease
MSLIHKSANHSLPSFSSSIFQFFSSLFSSEVIPKTIWALGTAMLLINISVIMVYSLNALFLSAVMGISSIWIGLLEGTIEALSSFMKLFSGVLSDYLKRRKNIMLIGYALTVISKPLVGISSNFTSVFISRIIERVGNGMQSTPRDALVGDVAPPKFRGACYGLQRSLGVIGSITGTLLAMVAMLYTTNNFQLVFLLASIPAAIALGILYFAVKEPKHAHYANDIKISNNKERHPIHVSDLKRLGKDYWGLMIVVAIFMLARVSETFIVLDAVKNFGLPKSYASSIMTLYNITYCLCSFPIGLISDRIGRYSLLVTGIITLMIADFLIALAPNLPTLFIGVLFWGCQLGISQNIFASLIADLAPEDLRGTGFGVFYLISGISTIAAGASAGTISHLYGEGAVFLLSLSVAGLSLLALLFFAPGKKKTVDISPKA